MPLHSRVARSVALVLLVSAGTPRLVSGDGDGDDGPSAESVATARASGVKFLSARQDASGSWGAAKATRTYAGGNADNAYTYPLGPTALALYALLASGVPKDDTRIEKGFAWIDRRMQSGGTTGFSSYETSAVLLATTARGGTPLRWRRSDSVRLASDDRRRAQAAVDSLLAVRTRCGLLGWRYNQATSVKPPGGDQDLSSTGLAALALFTADRCGLKIPTELWPDLARFAMAQQDETGDEHDRAVDGGLIDLVGKSAVPAAPPARSDAAPEKDHARGCAYIKSAALPSDEGSATGGVTACAIAILQLSRLLPPKRAVKAWGAKEQASARQSLLDACAWLDENWSASKNPKKESNDLYHLLYLSHVADAMDLLGSARVGAHAWEREMSEYLLSSQAEDGSWNSNSSHEPRAVLDTAFALLFFARPFSASPVPAAGGK